MKLKKKLSVGIALLLLAALCVTAQAIGVAPTGKAYQTTY